MAAQPHTSLFRRGTSRYRGMVARRIAGYVSVLARTVSELPMIESLESRRLFAAATLADASPLTTTTTTAAEPTTALNFTKVETNSLNFTKIEFAKVSMQDFHFVSKVTMQDFHFVMKANKPSPS
jgi:hypothetical protein